MHPSTFELLELPNGTWCVARLATVSGDKMGYDPVGFYTSRDDAELAILRASPSPRAPLAPFSPWIRQG
jgi:hypothetical protein